MVHSALQKNQNKTGKIAQTSQLVVSILQHFWNQIAINTFLRFLEQEDISGWDTLSCLEGVSDKF